MKIRFRARPSIGRAVIALFVTSLGAPLVALQQVEPPRVAPPSLKTVTSRLNDILPTNLDQAIADRAAAVQLGKAVFWDMQLGSDGIQACASCHFHAGADSRAKNQLNPGPQNQFATLFSGTGGPNSTPSACDFPFRRLAVPDDNSSAVVHDVDDRVSSQGVFRRAFTGISGTSVDNGTILADDLGFSLSGINTRRVEPRNTPTVLNSVLLHRLFWDGRANNVFNGVNPFGANDPSARVFVRQGGNPGDAATAVQMLFQNAATASQSVGPPLSGFEMSWDGRSFANLGVKMMPLFPLAGQLVAPDDSVLGGLSASPNPGLTPGLTYEDLIKTAFRPEFWDASGTYDGVRQIERNFSLFFGLSILAYESTLNSDDSPYDRYMDGGGEGGTQSNALTAQQKEGLDIFLNRGSCLACHAGPEFAGASQTIIAAEGVLERMLMADGEAEGNIQFVTSPAPEDPELAPTDYPLSFDPRGKLVEIRLPSGSGSPVAWGFAYFSSANGGCTPSADESIVLTPGANAPANSSFLAEIRFKLDTNCRKLFRVDMKWQYPGAPGGDYRVYVGGRNVGSIHMDQVQPPAVYDVGFYNIGVRPTGEDVGNGGGNDFGPFSLSARAKAGQNVDGGRLQPPVGANERIAINGAFKAPSLRNIELTGPYMHNGGFASLEQVVDFYTGGAHFFHENISDLDPEVGGMGGMDADRKAALVSFLKALTDERVRFERAPFDHPQLFVPNGQNGDTVAVAIDAGACNGPICQAEDVLLEIPAVGAGGRVNPIQAFDTQLAPCVNLLALENQPISELTGGPQGQLRVSLSHRPTAPVTLQLGLSLPGQAIVEPTSLTFTPNNWFETQLVRVRGVQDGVADGNQALTLTIPSAQSTDPVFNGPRSETLDFTAVDSGVVWTTIQFEAESGSRTSPMVAATDATASNATYIWVPNGTGNNTSTTGTTGVATFNFNVSVAGSYRIWGLKKTPNASDDQFLVKMDNGTYQTWTCYTGHGNNWAWDLVNNSGAQDPILYNLSAGQHTLRVRWRDDGAKLDRLILTNGAEFVPADGHPVAP